MNWGQIFTDIAKYRGAVVSVKRIRKDHIQITRDVLLQFSEVTFFFSF